MPDLAAPVEVSGVASAGYVEAGYTVLLWAHAAFALALFVGAAVLHGKVNPYRFDFQNQLEMRFYVSGCCVVVLGCVYTFMPEEVSSILTLSVGCRRLDARAAAQHRICA